MKTLVTRLVGRASARHVGLKPDLPISALFATLCCLTLTAGMARADTVGELLAEYTAAGAGPFGPAAGEALWHREFAASDETARACTTCHMADLGQPGKHATTGKPIEPLAPSVNPKRLSDRREIEKWLIRNCKWTMGRECTGQEKGDLLTFLSAQ